VNNIGQGFSRSNKGTIVIGNLKVSDGEDFFQNYRKFDFRLKRGSRAVNSAITARYFDALTKIQFPELPDKDASGTNRPQGLGRDIGAYERLEK
ncbi:MAG: choice-of-anchor Q domain-containing protein, partial [Methyloligellaceae bacterium]